MADAKLARHSQRDQVIESLGFVRFESRFKVRVDVEHLCQPIPAELVRYLFGQVAELEDAIRFAQSSTQADQHPYDFR
jgi:hypothetical protein